VVLVDLSDGAAVALISNPHDEGAGAGGMGHDMMGMIPNEERFTAPFEVMRFRTSAELPATVRAIPRSFATIEETLPEPSVTRELTLNDMGNLVARTTDALGDALADPVPADHAGHGMAAEPMPGMAMPMPGMEMADAGAEPVFGINGRPFDMARIDFEVPAGSTERWTVGGEMMGHPFHIHGVRFQVVRDKGGAPRPENRGWKDTVFVDGEVELLVQFSDPATAASPFMFHCHILEHEDRGMMGQFTVG
jgi:FtsP/CotA-like multicopper oxidase with cupredoxin domain